MSFMHSFYQWLMVFLTFPNELLLLFYNHPNSYSQSRAAKLYISSCDVLLVAYQTRYVLMLVSNDGFYLL